VVTTTVSWYGQSEPGRVCALPGVRYSQQVPTDQGWEERVLANFMDAGRLKQIPARAKKRRVVLRWLADHFRPAERYPEAQVNDILRRYHDDFALLRRLLVDEELMHREAGMYWRAGTLPYPGANALMTLGLSSTRPRRQDGFVTGATRIGD